jgi:glutamate synthase domain-containing protein 3
MNTIVCEGKSVREINREIKAAIASGAPEIVVEEPGARHNLGVALTSKTKVRFEGSVGYYCGGLIDHASLHIAGSAGWGVGESKMGGNIIVEGNAGNGAGAAMRGGELVIKGHASSRAGVSIKGGTLIIGDDCGYMTGFMGQKGTIIICGNSGEALADSMYETTIFVGGTISDLGNDAVIEEPSEADLQYLKSTLCRYDMNPLRDWKKVVSGRRLWNFDRNDVLWREAL